MSGEPTYIKNLRTLTRSEPNLTHLEEIEKELFLSNSDRAIAVLFGSFVETSLKRLLEAKLRKGMNDKDRERLFGLNGAMGNSRQR